MTRFVLVMKAVPGQTSCLAIRDVRPKAKRKLVVAHVVAPRPRRLSIEEKIAARLTLVTREPQAPVLPNGEPRFCGGTLEKTRTSWIQGRAKNIRREDNVRANNAKQHSRCVRPSRKSIRRFVLITEREWESIICSIRTRNGFLLGLDELNDLH